LKIKIAFLNQSQRELFSIIVFLIIAFIAAYVSFLKFQDNRKSIKIKENNQLILPANWSVTEQGGQDSLFKFGKETDEIVKPTIIFASSPYNQDTDFIKHIDVLIDQAKSATPSLKYTINNTLHQTENSSRYQLAGYYYESGTKINFDQEILLRQGHLYTITASYIYNQSNQEDVNQIILTIIENIDLLTSPELLLIY